MRKLDLEWSSHQEEGYHYKQHQATDQYGREWSWTYIAGQSGAEAYNIGYRDEEGIWHESSEQNGVLWDEWTDKNGNEHHGRLDPQGNWLDVWIDENDQVHQGFLADGEWLEWEPGIDLQGPWTQYTDSHGNVHHWATDQYGRKWDWYRDHHGNTDLGYTDLNDLWHDFYVQDGTWYDRWTDLDGNRNWRYQDEKGVEHQLLEANGVTYDTWKEGDRVYEGWRDETGLRAYGYRDENGDWHGQHKGPSPTDPWEPDAADAKGLWRGESYEGQGLPPGVEGLSDISTYKGELGGLYYRGVDEHGRQWEWTEDDQGNPTAWSYEDLAGQRHYVSGPDINGVMWDSWTDWSGNEHRGQVDQYGNVHDSWTDASGTNHDEVHPPGKIGEGQQRPPTEEPRPLPQVAGENLPEAPHQAHLAEEALAEEMRTQPPPGDDQEGQPPVLDPNTQPMPMPSPPDPPEGDDGGIPGLGVPYEDFIPTWPMIQDPATGEWRNAELGELAEIPEPQTTAPNVAGKTLLFKELFDPDTPGPTLDPALFDPNAPGPTLDPRLLLLDPDSPGPTIDPALLDPMSPGPTLDPALFTTLEARLVPPDSPALIPGSPEYDPKAVPSDPDNELIEVEGQGQLPPPSEAGPTLDPALLDPAAPGPTLDPALLDPSSPGPTVDPALLDADSPGPTLDPALLDPTALGPTVDANLLDPMAPGPTVDPAAIDPATGQPLADPALAHTSFADPALTDPAFIDPSLTDDPALTDPVETGQDLDGPLA